MNNPLYHLGKNKQDLIIYSNGKTKQNKAKHARAACHITLPDCSGRVSSARHLQSPSQKAGSGGFCRGQHWSGNTS